MRAVALFCDYTPLQAGNICDCVQPTTAGVEAAMQAANAESIALCGSRAQAARRRLRVLLLRADGGTSGWRHRAEVGYLLHMIKHDAVVRTSAEVWHLDELQYNVLQHSRVPLHAAATPGEIATLKRVHGANALEALPLLLDSDPVARWLGFEAGVVVRISRVDSRFGNNFYYRRVVATY